MPGKIKRLISGKNKRTTEIGFDLNLNYIKPNIIAMGFPYENLEGLFRLHGVRMDEVVRFLNQRHPNHYRVYNLCSERSYDSSKFLMRAITYPFDVNCSPPFELIQQFCEDVSAFLKADDKNVAVIHCCNGVQRTGIMICSYLLHDKIFHNANDALRFFAAARTQNGVAITIPSQRRYVQYYEHMLNNNFTYSSDVVLLQSLKFVGNPCTQGASCSPHFIIKIQKVQTYTSKLYDCIRRSGNMTEFLLQQPIPLSGDVTVEFFHQSRFGTKERMFSCCFNTSFADMHLQSQQSKGRCKLTPKMLKRPLSTSLLDIDSTSDDDTFENDTRPQNNSPLLTVPSHSILKKSHSLSDVHKIDNKDILIICDQHSSSGLLDSQGSEHGIRDRTQSDFQFLPKKMLPQEKQLRKALKRAGRHAGIDITTGFTTVVHKPVKQNHTSQKSPINARYDPNRAVNSNPTNSSLSSATNGSSSSNGSDINCRSASSNGSASGSARSNGLHEESLDCHELVTIVLPLSELDHTVRINKHVSGDFQLHIVLSVDARVIKNLEKDECFDSDDSQD